MPGIWWQQYTTWRYTKGFQNHQWRAAYRRQRHKNTGTQIVFYIERNRSAYFTPHIVIGFSLDKPPQCLMLRKF